MNLRRIKPVVVKEFRQIGRDWRTLGVLVFVPVFMLVMFGYALDMDVTHVPAAVYDGDRSPDSRALIDQFFLGGHGETFRQAYVAATPQEVDRLLVRGAVKVGLVVPAGFGETLRRGGAAPVQVLVDGTNASEAAAVAGYAEAFVQQYAALRAAGAGVSVVLPVDYRPRIWYNPELKSLYFLLPGLVAFILMMTTVISTALSVVRERERGSMEQLMVSPLRPVELILGKLLPYALIAFTSAVLILAAGAGLFAMPMRGSYGLLFLATLLYLFGALGMGLVISTVARTQETAFFIAVFASFLPTFLLSGFVFPIANMPPVIQAVTYIVPARYFLVVLRDIVLKGAGIEAFWEQLVFLTAFMLLMIGLGTARLRRIMG